MKNILFKEIGNSLKLQKARNMINLHLFDEYFDIYFNIIKPTTGVDEYLDFINSIPVAYREIYTSLGFEKTKSDFAFAWFCLENRNWYLQDFIGYQEPGEFDKI